GSDYFRERANDLQDVRDRLVRNLRRGKLLSAIEYNAIVIAETLTAADIVLFSRRNILGCATDFGGPTSHVSIMARGLGVPAVVSMHGVTDLVNSGDTIILDGFNGRLIINPTEETLAGYRRLQERFENLLLDEKQLVPLEAKTLDGHEITLQANLEFREEVELVEEYGGEGIGLFRTEFLFLMRGFDDYSEEEQFETYKEIVEKMHPYHTTFRLLDLGGDKMLPMGHREHNPFLGWRGVRILLDKPELLQPQLRAILRASAFGAVKILVPMVSSLGEVRRLKEALATAMQSLDEAGQLYDAEVPLGIMVEVPAVALMAEHFAAEVDFFSIGTNDLTQYLLAVDRGNDMVASRYHELDPAVLTLIRRVIEAGRAHQIPVNICGEIASNPLATALLIGLGIDSLSATPTFLPEIKRVVRSMRRKDAESLANQVVGIFDPRERKKTLMQWLKNHAADYYAFLMESESSSLETIG
ncbi:MAG: phosphoenolpyruvate--protein phosphotransferase, partial [Bacteroidota bacterium]